jgi:hypothetical protein
MVKKTKPKITQTVKRRRVYWLVLDANGEQSFASYDHIEAIDKLAELNSVVHGPNHAKARRIGNAITTTTSRPRRTGNTFTDVTIPINGSMGSRKARRWQCPTS